MQITVNSSLGDRSFHLEEDVYTRLQQYLARLDKEFADETGAAEIINDIECRMADLFAMRLNPYKQVITVQDLEQVIAILGSPEAINSGTAVGTAVGRTSGNKFSFSSSRRFYRDYDHRLFGGVCSGIAAYFSWPPLVFRILFVALLFAGGFGLALYLVLWIVLPEAKTSAQKLEMRGEPVTIANIKGIVKNEYQTVRQRMKL
ncbi:MAG: DNA-binding transcriptional activator PspC [bacterium ADurb.Bin478]|nr:MAG: DNA-binding transcriptional activator PspC [bacterium ADurb.Bin478]